MTKKITTDLVEKAQQDWGNGVVKIGKIFTEKGDLKRAAQEHVKMFYAYDKSTVLFKPTKAAEIQFRDSYESAVSYFVGGNSNFHEDKGFALQPWTKVRFENSGIIINEKTAFAMGNYFFTDLSGTETKVEYTFGYLLDENDELKINIHHSSLPYSS